MANPCIVAVALWTDNDARPAISLDPMHVWLALAVTMVITVVGFVVACYFCESHMPDGSPTIQSFYRHYTHR